MSEKLTLKSSDGKTFELDKAVAAECQVIKGMIEMNCTDGSIPLLNVTGAILARLIEFCYKHTEFGSSSLPSTSTTTSSITEPSKSAEDELKAWDADFIKVDHKTLYDLYLAADYLNIKSLLDLTRQTLEDIFKGKTIDEIHEIFNDVTLKSSDGMTFEVYKAVVAESQVIKGMIEYNCANGVIPLPNVTSPILAMVIEFCKKHTGFCSSSLTLTLTTTSSITELSKSAEDELKAWDADFVKVDRVTLFNLILAANYLDIKSLLDLTCQAVADMIKGKTPAEICETFNIKNTPDEEEEVRRENQWAFE